MEGPEGPREEAGRGSREGLVRGEERERFAAASVSAAPLLSRSFAQEHPSSLSRE